MPAPRERRSWRCTSTACRSSCVLPVARRAHDACTPITKARRDATLSGTPLSLLRLAGPAPEAALRGGAVHIEGDAEVAQTFSELLQAAQPDLEEELSRVVGDVAAHQIGNAARTALGFARRAHDTLLQNVSEYLQEEGRDVPNRTEAEEFLHGVDRLRDDVDRLEARLKLLEARNDK